MRERGERMAGGAIYAQQELWRRPPGWEPNNCLFSACALGDDTAVEVLLRQGQAEVNATAERMDMTPLMFAADGGHTLVVKMLLASRARVNVRSDGYGFTAMHWCCRNGHLRAAELLALHPGCDRDVPDETQWTPRDWARHGGHDNIVDFLQRVPGLALLAARQRLCLAMIAHARLGQACAAQCLPSSADGSCELRAAHPGGQGRARHRGRPPD